MNIIMNKLPSNLKLRFVNKAELSYILCNMQILDFKSLRIDLGSRDEKIFLTVEETL